LGRYLLESLSWERKELPVVELNFDLPDVEVLYVYGLCKGLYEYCLRSKRRFVLLEDDQGLLAEAAYAGIEVEWLQSIDDLAERYPNNRIEVIAIPGRTLPRNLRERLLRKTTLAHAYLSDRLQTDILYRHFEKNHRRADFYANRIRLPDIPAIVCGAGPSLETEKLKELEGRALIIAGGSAIAALSNAGVDPHFAIAIDPTEEEFHRLHKASAYECPLLFSTRVHPAIFSTCNGPFGYLRAGIGGLLELWFDQELGLTDPLIGQELSDEALSVTSVAIAFARHIGCKTIILNGVDLAYTEGKRYAEGVGATEFPSKSIGDRLLKRKDKRGNPVFTAVRWIMEAAALGHYAKKAKEIRWINTTSGGLRIPSMEEMALEQVPFDEQWDLRGLVAKEIALNPMPPVPDLMTEIKSSLARVIGHLQILAGEIVGSKVLAEEAIREELAGRLLFYDTAEIIGKLTQNKWKMFLEFARRF
jgi:hypothetical protein